MAETASHFQAANKMQEILASHDAELDSRIGADVYDQDTVQLVQNELAADACQKMQDWLSVFQKQLKCPDTYTDRVKANCERLENEISTFIFETELDYKAALEPSKFRSEGEMAAIEPESRSKAMEALKNFSHKLPELKMSSLRADLVARLDDISEKAREEVKNNEEIMDEQLDITIEEAAAEYKKSMVGLLLSEGGRITMEREPSEPSLPSTT